VRKIPTPTTDRIDMLGCMIQEIPQFLFFLNRRKMNSKQKSRMWFSPDEIHTEALKKLIEHSLPTVVKEIREKVRQFFYDFEDTELHITPKQIATHMLGGRYGSYYIIRECKTHLNVDNLIGQQGEKTIKTCIYKWIDYAEGMDKFEIRTNKHVGQPLVFKRQDFVKEYETKALFPPKPEPTPESVQIEMLRQCSATIDYPKDSDTPF
jgi:hypothetical protein